jgi:hypothetical protein
MIDSPKLLVLHRREWLKVLGVGTAVFLSGCLRKDILVESAVETLAVLPTEIPPSELPAATADIPPTLEPSLQAQMAELLIPLELPPMSGNEWMDYPVVPESISERMKKLYRLGQEMGRDPHRFSVVGDCQSIPVYFLAAFDGVGDQDYYLGEQYANLQDTIDYFAGSFTGGVAANGGQNVAAVFSPLWSDPQKCASNEGPLACELRLSNPCLVLISLEENWNGDAAGYQTNLVKIVEYCISQAVIPVLTTKASNLEGDYSINRTIADTARRYELPLWNYWLSLQDLPTKGLIEDGFHLTQGWSGRYDYRKVEEIKSGWAMRNLTGLEMLDKLRRELSQL